MYFNVITKLNNFTIAAAQVPKQLLLNAHWKKHILVMRFSAFSILVLLRSMFQKAKDLSIMNGFCALMINIFAYFHTFFHTFIIFTIIELRSLLFFTSHCMEWVSKFNVSRVVNDAWMQLLATVSLCLPKAFECVVVFWLVNTFIMNSWI